MRHGKNPYKINRVTQFIYYSYNTVTIKTGFKMTTEKEVTNWGSSLPGRYGKSMRWELWHSGLVGPVLAFWEGPMQMIKEGASPFGSVLGSLQSLSYAKLD